MRLPDPPGKYDPSIERQRNRMLEQETRRLVRVGADVTLKGGAEIEVSDGRVILTSPDGSRFELTVDNAGNLGTSSL